MQASFPIRVSASYRVPNANSKNRKRRVKCDENRPECHRCCKFGRRCAGYGIDKTQEDLESKPEKRILLPKAAATLASIMREPSEFQFETDNDFHCFQLFCDETSQELSGVFKLQIWNRIVLQASQQHSFIRHAIISIGSLSNSVKRAMDRPDQSEFCGRWSSHRLSITTDFALQHYNKFLHGSRKALMEGNQDRRTALIACLLIICIETLQWHHHQALNHIYSGMALLDEWLSRTPPSSRPGISSPEPLTIEDEIVQQFRTLEVEASIVMDPLPSSYHAQKRLEGTETIQSMPEIFTSVEEARLYLDLICRRVHHFIFSIRPGRGYRKLQSQLETPGLQTGFDTIEPFPGLSSALEIEQELYTQEIQRWQTSFDPLFVSGIPSSTDYLPISLLKIRSNVLLVTLYGELTSTQIIYDSFFLEFQEIVSLARAFFDCANSERILPKGSFNSNSGLIHPLRLVAEKCRVRSLRREAIRLLRSRPWREGCWWSLSTAQLGSWLMNVEEEGVDTEYVPEWARARLLEVCYYEDEKMRTVRTACIRGVGDEAELKVGNWNWKSVSEGSGTSAAVLEELVIFEADPGIYMTIE
ncbi:uncharacterized protein PAC_14225 [Phialocephala subalpina]|uniref:Zn(2)-C6 fungal-type domain-containing protein n=1 Tax=Phialocephala subalpina TaxID=576137 RepID=A0A1L7XHB1_9HELO|nr:uncharacterized protein PAC_14225 [Phialocephala subalpina]